MIARSALVIAASALAASHASGEVTTTSSTVPADTSTRDYVSGGAIIAGWYADRMTLMGLEKFDPSLGTLTGVALTTNFGYSWDASVQSGAVTDASQPHEVVTTFDSNSFRFVLGYRPDTTTTVFAEGVVPLDPMTASGGAGDAPASASDSGSGTVAATLVDMTGFVDLDDFIGTGDVTTLIVANYHPYSAAFQVTNADGATAQSNAERTAGTVSLQYTYIVPEPASLALLALGVALVARRRGGR